MKHKHCELIKAWADGAVIEHNNGLGYWVEQSNPQWNTWDIYRIKPEPKPDVECLEYAEFNFDSDDWIVNSLENKRNLKLTFDGETGELKSAEVLK